MEAEFCHEAGGSHGGAGGRPLQLGGGRLGERQVLDGIPDRPNLGRVVDGGGDEAIAHVVQVGYIEETRPYSSLSARKTHPRGCS